MLVTGVKDAGRCIRLQHTRWKMTSSISDFPTNTWLAILTYLHSVSSCSRETDLTARLHRRPEVMSLLKARAWLPIKVLQTLFVFRLRFKN
jgi:hypothetical protein